MIYSDSAGGGLCLLQQDHLLSSSIVNDLSTASAVHRIIRSSMFPRIRLVTFDALYTIITPRLPVHVQYSQIFEPYVGVLDPEALRKSFRVGEKYLYVLSFPVPP
jgi:hypothetical protein